MVSQSQSVCPDCRGEGTTIREKDRCKNCHGKKTVKQNKILEVKVKRGMREGQKITFHGEGDQEPDVPPGDVIIMLQGKPHDVFQREGDDLIMKRTISLTEALCGIQFSIKHLDGRNLVFRSTQGDVIDPDAVRGIVGEGMPRTRNPMDKGNLYIQFSVTFPVDNFVTPEAFAAIETLLPPGKKQRLPKGEHVEEVVLQSYEDHHRDSGGRGGRGGEAYNEDEDDEDENMGGPRVQCAHQ
jgi:DnaJ family protein A protein 2